MSSLPLFVGLDYHQDEVQVCVLGPSGEVVLNRKFDNDSAQICRAVEARGQVKRVAIEACCGAAALADELVTKANWPVQMAHPGFVARMKHSPDKTDFGDARMLADLTRVDYLPQVWLAPEAVRELRRLVRYRQQRVDERRDTKLRLRALLRENRLKPPKEIRAWTKAWFKWLLEEASWSEDDRWLLESQLRHLTRLSEDIVAVEKRLAARAESDALMQKLLSIHCVGLITAVTLRAEIGRFDRFRNGKQLARFCGLSPRNASSGQRQADAGLIRAGNPQLRAVLIELGHRLIQQRDPRWGALGYSLLNRGKKKNIAVAAVANRWIRWLFYEVQRPAEAAPDLGSGSTKAGPPLPSSPSHQPRTGRG